jgi:acyl-CoA oxidase
LEELTEFIYGNEMMEKRREIANLVVNNPAFKQDDKYFMNSEEAFDNAMRKNVHYVEVAKQLNSKDNATLHFLKMSINEELPAGLHESMFIPTIQVWLVCVVLTGSYTCAY